MSRQARIRMLQLVALYAPGASGVRVWLHRKRGVKVGRDVFIGTDVLIETSKPELVFLGDRVIIGMRATIIAHFFGPTVESAASESDRVYSVRIEDDAFIGPGAIILPGVTVGRGAVVAAGSVVTGRVREFTLVQGNPARPVARSKVPLAEATYEDFYRTLRPIR